MSWIKRVTGLAGFDIFIQAAVTIAVMGFFGIEGDEEMLPGVIAASFVVLGLRRHFALKKGRADPEGLTTGQMAAYRFEELEERMGELEAVNGRMVELEERLDFAERLLAQSPAERVRIGEESQTDG